MTRSGAHDIAARSTGHRVRSLCVTVEVGYVGRARHSPTGRHDDPPLDRSSAASALAEQLLAVLAEGAFTATYKYAVLLALVDLCVERSTPTGEAPNKCHHPAARRKGSGSLLASGQGFSTSGRFVRTPGSRRGS